MPQTLVAFGCSFTYGDELLDPNIKAGEPVCSRYNDEYRLANSYPGIVAKHYKMDLVNTAIPGGSLETMRYALHWASNSLDLTSCVFLVGLTQSHRTSYFDPSLKSDQPWNRFQLSTRLKSGGNTEYHELNKLWMTNCWDQDWEQFNLAQTIGYFRSFCVPTVIMPVYENEPKQTSPDHTPFTLQEICNESITNYAPGKHPNENGHKKVASRLIQHIDHVKIL